MLTAKVANLADIFTSRLLSEIPPALESLLQALQKLPNLHTIDLSDNAFGLNTQAPLVSFLSAHTPLRHLILNNNGLGPAAGNLIADALTKLAEKKSAAQDAPALETIVCGRNRLESGSMAAWARAFAQHTGVRTVRMTQNGIRQEGIAKLFKDGLAHARGLQVLDLQDNTFTSIGARALSDVVGGWDELRELGIGDCLLGARGGVMLTEAFWKGQNKQLEILRLQYNDIDGKSLKGIADAFEKLPRLRRVELNGNRFSEEDEHLDRLRGQLGDRKKSGIPDFNGSAEEDWGIDELDELDEESDEEGDEVDGEDDDNDVETSELAEKELKTAEEAEDENVPLESDKAVDDLADKLGKTGL